MSGARHALRTAPLLLLALVAGARAAPEEQRTWSLEASEEVRSRLAEADRLLERGVLDRGALLLQEVVDRFPDHLVADATDPLRFTGARVHALARLRALDADGHRAYLAAVDGVATRDIARATARRDAAALADAGERYAHAGGHGRRALVAAADLSLARGEPTRAIAPLRLLLRLDLEAGRPPGPAAARLARALAGIGDAEGLAALERTLGPAAAAPAPEGEGGPPLPRILEEARALAGPPRERSGSPTLLGDGARSGAGPGLRSLGELRWREANSRWWSWTPADLQAAHVESSSVGEAMNAAVPVVPAAVAGVLYQSWQFHAEARDLYTGRVLWRHSQPPAGRAESSRTHGALLTAPAVADGLVYVPLQVPPPPDAPRSVYFSNQEIIPYIAYRRLFALDAATGRVVWTHAQSSGPDDPFQGPLRGINVTSPALVAGDLVIASGAVYRGNFAGWTFACDRRTGSVRWMTRLGSGQQELNLFGRPVKEVPIAAAATDGERVFVLTNMGFVSCLDLATGRPLWTRGYQQEEVPYYQHFWSTPERRFTFAGSPPVVSGDTVVVAPADSPAMLALDTATGQVRWRHRAREEGLGGAGYLTRLLGADGENVYAAGSGVAAFALRGDGRRRWFRPFDGSRELETSSGFGVLAGPHLLVPSTRHVYVLEAATGRLVRKEALERPVRAGRRVSGGGNLVVCDGVAVFARLDGIEAWYPAEDVQARVAARLRENPGDPDAMIEGARILLGAGRPDDAVPVLERAIAAADTLPAAHRDRARRSALESLFEVHVARADECRAADDPRGAAAAYRRAADRAPEPTQAVRALLLAAAMLKEAGDVAAAAATLEAVVSDHGGVVVDADEDPSTARALALAEMAVAADARGDATAAVAAWQRILDADAGGDVLRGAPAAAVAREAIEELLDRTGPAAYAPVEDAATAALGRARAAGDLAALERVARRWPNSAAAVAATIEEARLRLAAGDAEGAAGAARRALRADLPPPEEAHALWTLAEALAAAGRPAAARATMERLARTHPRETVDTGAGEERIEAAAARRLAAPDMTPPPPAPAPALRLDGPWRTLWQRGGGTGGSTAVVPVEGEPRAGTPILVVEEDGTVAALEPANGAERWRTPAPPGTGIRARLAGDVIALAASNGVTAVLPATGAAAWTWEPPGAIRDVAPVSGLLVVACDDADGSALTQIHALDPATGGAAWPVPLAVPGGRTAALEPAGAAVALRPEPAPRPPLRLVDVERGAVLPFQIALRRRGENATAELLGALDGMLVLRRSGGIEAYRTDSGLVAWALPFEDGRIATGARGAGDRVLVVDHREVVEALSAADGRMVWRLPARAGRRLHGGTGALAVGGGAAYTLSQDRGTQGDVRVESWNLADGSPRWSALLHRGPALGEIALVDGAVVVRYLPLRVAEPPGGVLVLDPADGREVDRVEDGRLAGGSHRIAGGTGVLAAWNETVLLVRGRR